MVYDLQKASMWKRISAALFDFIMLGIAAVLFAWLLSTALGFDSHKATMDAKYEQYGAEYGVSFDMSLDEYDGMTNEEAEKLDAAYAALAADSEAAYAYNMLIQLTFLITALGILMAFLLLEFSLPMMMGNGQTLGKKIFGVALMSTEGIRINSIALFIRSILGKYTIETMIPVFLIMMISYGSIGLIGTIALGTLLLVQIVLAAATKNNSLIHDLLAATVAVDMQSQMIFATREDMIAYKEKKHAEMAAKKEYP